jgi:hypothetical protein
MLSSARARLSALGLAFTSLAATAGCGAPSVPPSEGPATCWVGKLDNCQTECDGGRAQSCYDLASFIEDGWGSGGAERSRELYDKACSMGFAQACARLGLAYFKGDDLAGEDRDRAKPLLEKGCAGGIGPACGALATYYEPAFVARAQRPRSSDDGGGFGLSGSLSVGSPPEAPTAPTAPSVQAPTTPSAPAVPQAPSAPSLPQAPSAPTAPTLP